MSDRFLHIDAKEAEQIIEKLLSDYPELVDDDELKINMIEGETDFEKIVSRAVKEYNMAGAFATGLAGYIKDLQDRKGRFQKKQEAMKRLISSLMEAAQEDKITLPFVTAYFTTPRTIVNVTDANQLPQGFYTKTPNKTAIKAALEANQEIPGAELALGESGLTIRTK